MNIEEILSMMDDVLDKAVAVPFSGKKSLIDIEAMNNLIYEVRANLPREIEQARGIVSERKQIINNAQKEADRIVKTAEERARQIVSTQDIVRASQARAEEIMINAQQKSKELRSTTKDYVDNMLLKSEEAYKKNLDDIRKARTALRNSSK